MFGGDYGDHDDFEDDIVDDALRINDYDDLGVDWVCDCDICTGKRRPDDHDIGKYEDYEPEEEIKEEHEKWEFTCNKCVSVHYCEYAWDDFNLNGKCLAR